MFTKGYTPWNKGKKLQKRERKIGYEIKETGCWEWQNWKNNKGYGMMNNDDNTKKVLVHRYNYEKKYGEVQKGLELDHLCRNTICVNPDHLEPVTHAVNCQRGRQAKLTIEKVVEIRKILNNGKHSNSQIAKLFGISRANVNEIKHKYIWNF